MFLKQQNKTPVNFFTYKLKFPQSSKACSKKVDMRQAFIMDPQETNPVYNHLRQSRNNRHILQFVLGLQPETKQSIKDLVRSQSYSPNFAAFQKHTRSVSSEHVQQFRSKGQNIYDKADKMTSQMKLNKRKFSILGQYNQLLGRYYEVVPKIQTQTDKELFFAHHQIQKLCNEQSLLKDKDFVKRATFFKRYEEPKVRLKTLKKNKKIAVIQKRHVTEIDQQFLINNNTISF